MGRQQWEGSDSELTPAIEDGEELAYDTPQRHAAEPSWYQDPGNVTRLGRILVAHGWDAQELQHYYEAPYRWSDEWEWHLALEVKRKAIEKEELRELYQAPDEKELPTYYPPGGKDGQVLRIDDDGPQWVDLTTKG